VDNVGAAELDVGGDVGVDGDSDGGVQAATVSASAPKTAAVVRMAECMRRILKLGFMPGFGIGTEPRGYARRAGTSGLARRRHRRRFLLDSR